MKRLLILGAGPFQVSGIRTAVALGYHVITVDNQPANIGHQYAHESFDCSTTDISAVIQLAQQSKIDAVCTFSSDVAVPTVAAVASALDLPGPPFHAAEIMSSKDKFRSFQREAGLSFPDFVSGTEHKTLVRDAQRLRFPVVCKPVDTSGSRGVMRVDAYDPITLRAALSEAASYSRSGRLCVEEFVDGVEVGGDAFFLHGKLALSVVTHKHMEKFLVRGHSLPTNLTPNHEKRVVNEISAACHRLGYRNGPLNFDVIVSTENITILEMSARNGGNGIPCVVRRATNVDLEAMTILAALKEPLYVPPDVTINRGFGSLIFGSPSTGFLRELPEPAFLMRKIPELFEITYTKRVGDYVEKFVHNGNLIGYALFDCPSAASYDRIAAQLLNVLRPVIAHQS